MFGRPVFPRGAYLSGRFEDFRDPGQTVNSPQTKDCQGYLPAVNYTTTESSTYFVFLNSADAQDAYAYFLYHKQLGR
jgi:hypothetical protein